MSQAKVVSDCFIPLLVSPGSPKAALCAQGAAALSADGSHIEGVGKPPKLVI